MLTLAPPTVIDLVEQTSGIYWARILDDEGILLPGNVLQTLTLTLYVILGDGIVSYVNSRNAQDVLNTNNVEVFNTLQTRADGFQYNLKWAIQPADTTIIGSVPYERHIALFEWTWPNGKQGKHEVVLNIRNLTEV